MSDGIRVCRVGRAAYHWILPPHLFGPHWKQTMLAVGSIHGLAHPSVLALFGRRWL